jgi:DNA polymerase-3 subunit delta'
VAESEEQILPTILSRCQIIRVPLPEDADIQKSLVEKAGADPATAQRVAVMAEGNYREALQMLQHAEEDWQELLKEWLNASLKTGPQAQLKLIEELARLGREKQKQFLRYFNHLLETSIRLRVLGDKAPVVPAAEADFAARLNKISSVSQQEAIIKELDKAAYYIERNAHAKMLFLSLTIRLRHIIQHKSLILVD